MIKKAVIIFMCAFIGTIHAAEPLPLHHLDMKKITQLVSSARIAKEYFKQAYEQQNMWGESTSKKIGDSLFWEITTYSPANLFITTEHGTKIQVTTLGLNKIFDNKKLTGTTFILKTKTDYYIHNLGKDTYHWFPTYTLISSQT